MFYLQLAVAVNDVLTLNADVPCDLGVDQCPDLEPAHVEGARRKGFGGVIGGFRAHERGKNTTPPQPRVQALMAAWRAAVSKVTPSPAAR